MKDGEETEAAVIPTNSRPPLSCTCQSADLDPPSATPNMHPRCMQRLHSRFRSSGEDQLAPPTRRIVKITVCCSLDVRPVKAPPGRPSATVVTGSC